jgi:hypothetical protein
VGWVTILSHCLFSPQMLNRPGISVTVNMVARSNCSGVGKCFFSCGEMCGEWNFCLSGDVIQNLLGPACYYYQLFCI